jgi:hypothetical protein
MCGSEYTIAFPDVYCTARQNTRKTQCERKKKRLTSCSKVASYFKVRTATALRARSEAASEPSNSAGSEGECNSRTNAYVSTAAVAVLQTGKSSNLKRTLDRYFDSGNQNKNTHLDKRLTRAVFCSGSPLSLVESEDLMKFVTKLRPVISYLTVHTI